MAPLTRRQLLQQTAAGGGVLALAGCTAPNLPGHSDGESVPKPFTNDAYTASYTTAGRWLQDGHDGGRTGNAASIVPHGDVDVAWLRRPGTDPHSATAPIAGPDQVYIAYVESPDDAEHSETHLAGFDAESGEQQLDVDLGIGRAVGLALVDETLLAVTRGADYEQATLTGLARDDGSTQWTDTIPDVTGSPAVVDETCYLATRDEDNAVYAYTLDGTQQWRTSIEGECYTAPCADSGGVYVGLTDGRIAALDATTGDRRWSKQIATRDDCCPDIQGTPTVADGRLYVPGITEELVAADTADGTVLWRTAVVDEDYGNAIPSPAVTAETAYVNTYHGGLVAIDISDGTVRWRSAESGYNQSPAVGDGGVVVPQNDAVVAFETGDRQAWTIEITVPDIGMAGYIMDTDVALAHGMCYVGVADGRIYAIGSSE
ncbi:PQQ-like beta-propeller repeat protein [Halolamina sp. CBA1230]|uniref:outer membrane protein assembly factor BamB family protein n=1 Tax=Halolamina sp. CBA1230 TaxID=1853690 RepID=UPI0009A1B200|nr:PQQ-binding-like beta-propeller repeat protein [Halolamina sp. CBA1230]QKY20533.1 PQQ-like beta-propeller repeat protein [Halolamina sp. CBA1230]